MIWEVMLVDDHALLRAGTRAVIDQDERFEIVSDCADGASALAAARSHRPDLAVVDLGLPDMSGVELIEALVREVPECRTVVLSQHCEPGFVERALDAGASGYVVKGDPPEVLSRCLLEVVGGGSFLSSSIALRVMRPTARLSLREREVVTLISEGMSSREISDELGIAPRTVDAHRGRVMGKLGIHKITGLVRYAIREGLISA